MHHRKPSMRGARLQWEMIWQCEVAASRVMLLWQSTCHGILCRSASKRVVLPDTATAVHLLPGIGVYCIRCRHFAWIRTKKCGKHTAKNQHQPFRRNCATRTAWKKGLVFQL